MKNKITATNMEGFKKQFVELLQTNSTDEGVIYIWKTDEKL